MVSKIICFMGRLGSGKSFLADQLHAFLCEKGINSFKYSFSKPLKECLGRLLKSDFINNSDLKNESVIFKDKLISCRSLLQNLGDMMRAVDSECFVRPLVKDISDLKGGVAVIDDLRFFNEVLPLIKLTHRLYLVELKSDANPSEEGAHVSENVHEVKKMISLYFKGNQNVKMLSFKSYLERDTSKDLLVLKDFIFKE